MTDRPAYRALIKQLGWDDLLAGDDVGLQQFYPAFGGDSSRQIKGLVIEEGGHTRAVNATWWFDCKEEGDQLVVGKRTTFNARNLDSPFWKGALRHHRGIVVATGIGESKVIEGKKHQFLMESETPFLLGALYRWFPAGHYSCAVITRDEHPKFTPYHEKAFPLFLPIDRDFLDTWLDPDITQADVIDELLTRPRLYTDLQVQEVKSYKGAIPIGSSRSISAD